MFSPMQFEWNNFLVYNKKYDYTERKKTFAYREDIFSLCLAFAYILVFENVTRNKH